MDIMHALLAFDISLLLPFAVSVTLLARYRRALLSLRDLMRNPAPAVSPGNQVHEPGTAAAWRRFLISRILLIIVSVLPGLGLLIKLQFSPWTIVLYIGVSVIWLGYVLLLPFLWLLAQ